MNKDIELFQLEQFFKSMKIENQIIKCDEQPDFIVNILDNTFGIEITSIHQKREAAVAGTQRKIVRNACIKASEAKIEPIELKVWFNNKEPNSTKRYVKEGTEYPGFKFEVREEDPKKPLAESGSLVISWDDY